MSIDPETIAQQLALLAAHRRTLAHLLEQAAAYGGVVLALPQTAVGIEEARVEIAHIKLGLREGGVQVEDEPNDEAPLRGELAQRAGGDVVAGDKIGGDRVMGDKRIVDTGGGDYAVGNIDKRQGTFISGGSVQGSVIADNQGAVNVNYNYQQAALSPALHQLRAPVGDFVGRAQEIEQLVATLSKAAIGGAAAAISGVRGMGGIGKTELAYVVANQLKDTFPDAQLVVELRGANQSPLTPEAVLQTVIRAFERETELPDDLNQLQALYRDKLSGKKVLILADDAMDATQVRPLLPPQGCALLVTSRNRFALPGMVAIDLNTLPKEDAEKLLLEICPRIGEHAGKLAKQCGYLPLALRVSASFLKENDSRDVTRYLEQLRAERLKHLSDPDNPDVPQASVEASLKLSYEALEPGAQSALRQLSVFPTSFQPEAVRAVIRIESDTTATLERLRRRSLVDWDDTTKRYGLHDLVRVFGAARLEDAETVRLRYARSYLWVANHAENELFLKGNVLTGLALFDQERAHIDAGWEWARSRIGNRDADALIVSYADVTAHIGELRYDSRYERIPQLEAALDVARRGGDRQREGTVLSNLGGAYRNLKEPQKALELFTQRLAIAQELNDRQGETKALGNLANVYADLGDFAKAINYYLRALARAKKDGDWRGETVNLGNLASVYKKIGKPQTSFACYKRAIEIAHENGDEFQERLAGWNLSLVFEQYGNPVLAAELMSAWVPYAQAIRHPSADESAARLRHLLQWLAARGITVLPNTDEV